MNKTVIRILTPALLTINMASLANNGIEEILVHGSSSDEYLPAHEAVLLKNGLPISETPVTIQVIPNTVLADQGVASLQDAVRNVSGVQPNFSMGGAYERFTIRGFTQSIAAYRNGILFPVSRYHRANVEQIEILKGPAALELGMGDPGGAINVVTYQPTAEQHYGFTQTAGSLSEFASIFNSSGALGTENLLYRFDASWEHTGGYRDTTDSTEKFVAPSLIYNYSNTTRFTLNLEFANAEYTYDQGLHAWGDGLIDLPRERSYGQSNALQEYDNQTAELVINHQFNDEWSLQAGYLTADSKTYFRGIYATGNPSPGNTIVNRSAWFGPEETRTQSGWFTFNGKFDTGMIQHNLSVGYQANSYDYNGSASITFIEQIDVMSYKSGDSTITISDFDNRPKTDFIHIQDDKFSGFFIQDQVYFTDALIMLLGLRHDKTKSDFYDFYGPGGPWVGEGRVKDSATTGRLGFVFKTEHFSPYFSYSTSYGPGFNYLPVDIFEPEQAAQLEAGIKVNAFEGRAQMTISAYTIVKSNIPTPDPDIPNRTVTIGEAESSGLELDVIGTVSNSWSIVANLSLMNTEVTKDYSGLAGNELPNAPQHQAGLWLRYSLGNFTLGGGSTYVSERFGMANNSFKDDAYTRIDLFASRDFLLGSQPAKARLLLNNVTDELYFNMRSRWSNMPSEPFNAVASLSINF